MGNPWYRAVPASRIALGVVGGLILAAMIVVTASLLLQSRQGDAVLTGVHVDGDHVGGLDRDELQDVSAAAADRRAAAPVHVVAGDVERTVDRAELGADADLGATVDAAWERGRRGVLSSLGDHLRARTGQEWHLGVALTLDRAELDRWAQATADELSREARDASLGFAVDGDDVEVEATEPEDGRVLDAGELADELADALEGPGEVRVEVDVDRTEPAIAAADLDAARPDAERAVSGPVVLVNPSDAADLELSRVELAAIFDVVADPDAAEGERLQLALDRDGLDAHLDDEGAYAAEPQDASFVVDGDQVEIVGGTPGFAVDADEVADVVRAVAVDEEGAPDEPREAALPGEETPPDTTREELEELGIEQEVSSFTTELTPGEPRNTNIQLGAGLVDGALIEPGESFSLDDRLGPRTEERGFVENGYIDVDGELTEVVGGGTSQLATTFFNAAWFSGISVVDFQPHSLYFTRYPMGREATVSRGTVDLVVENDSPYAILVGAEASESQVTVRFFSSPWAEVDTWTSEPRDVVEGEERDGFTVDFGRTVTEPDGTQRSEEHTHTYDPEG